MSFKETIEKDPRWNERTTRELDRLLEVGPNQPMDSVQVEAIKEAGFKPFELRDTARANGLKAKIFNQSRTALKSLVIWDEQALTDVLEKNKDTLEAHDWPTTPFEFVEHEHKKGHPAIPELAEVVRQAYAELPTLRVFDPESPTHGSHAANARNGGKRKSRGAA